MFYVFFPASEITKIMTLTGELRGQTVPQLSFQSSHYHCERKGWKHSCTLILLPTASPRSRTPFNSSLLGSSKQATPEIAKLCKRHNSPLPIFLKYNLSQVQSSSSAKDTLPISKQTWRVPLTRGCRHKAPDSEFTFNKFQHSSKHSSTQHQYFIF